MTGGAGFIGSHVVDKLIDAGHTVRILDLTLSPYHPEVETALGSITDPDVVDHAVAGCDAVVHLAAVADVNHVHKGPSGAENVNVRGTANVLDAARRAGVERVVYGSTTWVYSDCPEEEVDEDTAVPPPTHLYTATKLAGELYCKAYAEGYGLERHDPALRHPLWATGARGRRGARVRGQGAEGRAIDPDGQRRAVPQLRLRGGPGRGSGGRPAGARRHLRLQPRPSRRDHDP